MHLFLFCRFTLLSVVLLAWGCAAPHSSGQTGGHVGDTTCRESRHPVERDERTSLGLSAADVLAWAEGSHTAPLDWKMETAEGVVSSLSVTPEEGLSSIELGIDFVDGPIRFVERLSDSSAGDVADDLCADALEIAVRVRVTTDNGALRDVLEGQLTVDRAEQAALEVRFELSELEGDFAVSSSDPTLSPADFQLAAQLTEAGFSGRLESVVQTTRSSEPNASDVPPELREDAKDTPTGGVWVVYGRFDSEQD